MHRVTRLKMTEVNPHLMCVLCGGYLIDATVSTECLHAFCKSCITKYVEGSKTCPICDTLIHKTRPILNLRPDKTLQDLVYKLVPGLFQSEMKRRRDFYQEHPAEGSSCTGINASEERGEVRDYQDCAVRMEEEKISLCLQVADRLPPYRNSSTFVNSGKEKMRSDCRYLLCPAGVTISVLQKFIQNKFDLQPHLHVAIFHSDESLPEDFTLQDIATLYGWLRRVPLKLYYLVYDHTQMAIQLPEPVPFHAQVKPLNVPSMEGKDASAVPAEPQAESAEKDTQVNGGTDTVYKCKKKKKKKKKDGSPTKGKDGSPIKIKLKASKKLLKKKSLKKHKGESNGKVGNVNDQTETSSSKKSDKSSSKKSKDKHKVKKSKDKKSKDKKSKSNHQRIDTSKSDRYTSTDVDMSQDMTESPSKLCDKAEGKTIGDGVALKSVLSMARFSSFESDRSSCNDSLISSDSFEDSDFSSTELTPQKLSVERIDSNQNGIKIRIRRSSGKDMSSGETERKASPLLPLQCSSEPKGEGAKDTVCSSQSGSTSPAHMATVAIETTTDPAPEQPTAEKTQTDSENKDHDSLHCDEVLSNGALEHKDSLPEDVFLENDHMEVDQSVDISKESVRTGKVTDLKVSEGVTSCSQGTGHVSTKTQGVERHLPVLKVPSYQKILSRPKSPSASGSKSPAASGSKSPAACRSKSPAATGFKSPAATTSILPFTVAPAVSQTVFSTALPVCTYTSTGTGAHGASTSTNSSPGVSPRPCSAASGKITARVKGHATVITSPRKRPIAPKRPLTQTNCKSNSSSSSSTDTGPLPKIPKVANIKQKPVKGVKQTHIVSAFIQPASIGLPPPPAPQRGLFSPSFHYPHSPIFSQYQYSPVSYQHGSSPRHVPIVYTALSPTNIPSPPSGVGRCEEPLELTTQQVRDRHREQDPATATYSVGASTRRMS